MPNKKFEYLLERNRKNNLIGSIFILILGVGTIVAGIILEFIFPVMIPHFGLYLLVPGVFAVFMAIIFFIRTRNLKVKLENL